MDFFRHFLTFWRILIRALRFGLLVTLVVSVAGCSVIEQFLPGEAAQTPVPAATAAEPLPGTTIQVPPAEQLPLPTYTPQPTYTPLPTYTPEPTYTPLPTYTIPPPPTSIPVYNPPPPPPASPAPSGGGCCTLRVRNHAKSTRWIGTRLPYGGNYIKPLYYVEFYLPGATWVRVWWCKSYWSAGNKWYKNNPWDSDNLYSCQYLDVYVDVPLKEIGVR